jgi:hypothetical protein
MIETRVLSLAPECDKLVITYMLEGNIQEQIIISRDHKGVVSVLIDRVDEPLECVREFTLGE